MIDEISMPGKDTKSQPLNAYIFLEVLRFFARYFRTFETPGKLAVNSNTDENKCKNQLVNVLLRTNFNKDNAKFVTGVIGYIDWQ